MKTLLHRFICWYLRHCGGAFHCYPYGDNGRYVVLMTERQYERYTSIAERAKPGNDLLAVHRAIQSAKDEL